MTRSELDSHLRQLEQHHLDDRDGGYSLARDILSLWERLDVGDGSILQKRLLQMVANKEPSLWGVALEVLVSKALGGTPQELEKLLRQATGDQEWREQIILALLRLRYNKALDIYIPYIQSSIDQGRPVCALLAYLYGVDSNSCIRLSSEFF